MHTSAFADWSIHQNRHVLWCVCGSRHQRDTQTGTSTKAINPSLDHCRSTHSSGLHRACKLQPRPHAPPDLILNLIFKYTLCSKCRGIGNEWIASPRPVRRPSFEMINNADNYCCARLLNPTLTLISVTKIYPFGCLSLNACWMNFTSHDMNETYVDDPDKQSENPFPLWTWILYSEAILLLWGCKCKGRQCVSCGGTGIKKKLVVVQIRPNSV